MKDNEIKELRLSLKMSRRDFAEKVGVCYESVRSWEDGRRQPSSPAIKLMRKMRGAE